MLFRKLHEERLQRPASILPRRLDRQASFSLSVSQRRMFHLEQVCPGLPTYNVPVAVRMTGPLEIGRLESGLNSVIGRHEILRTCFRSFDGEPIQVVSPEAALKLECENLAAIPVALRLEHACSRVLEYNNQKFDLNAGPPLRAKVLRLDETDHVAMITFHHLICDGQSLEIFMHELGGFYEAAGSDSPQLPKLPIQFADYVHWENEWLGGPEAAAQMAFWRQQLRISPELPLDYPRPSAPPVKGARIYFEIDEMLLRSLEALSRESGVRLMVTILAALQVLLKAWTRHDNTCIGIPVDNRRRAEFQPLIGFLSNALVLQTTVADDMSFKELLRRSAKTLSLAQAHQDLPFDQLLGERQSSHDPLRNPWFQTWFVFQTVPQQPRRISELELQPLQLDYGLSRYDLKVVISSGLQAVGAFEYNTEIFRPATIERLRQAFTTILKWVSTRPDARITDFYEIS
jgi:iturin family lipopeptide synthetase A